MSEQALRDMLEAYKLVPCTWGRRHDRDEIDAAIKALTPAPAGDWVMVPREPTEAMVKAADRKVNESTLEVYDHEIQDIYRAMLAAAPQPAQPSEPAPGEGLLPCPFCGSTGGLPGGLVPWVQCDECEASGPQRGTDAEAIDAWNRRAYAQQHRAGVDEELTVFVRGIYERMNRSYEGNSRILYGELEYLFEFANKRRIFLSPAAIAGAKP